MSTQKFYIREASETEARGPYNLEQLVSLAETGQVTVQTLWYDANLEDWAVIGGNDKLKASLFPEKRKLRMKAREAVPQSRHMDTLPPITVQDMLAGAEGKTADTKDKVDPVIMQARAAFIGMWSAIVALVLWAAGEMLPSADAIASFDLNRILGEPIAFLGVLDLFIATMLGLGVVSFYPLVRFRAALGVGMFGFVFFTQGPAVGVLAALAGGAGLFLVTLWVDLLPVLTAAGLGIAGTAGVAYLMIST
jgi:hypothetical protein